MIWFSDRLISIRLMLLNPMFRAMNDPMKIIPFHCFFSNETCALRDCLMAKGARTQKLKVICADVIRKGKRKP